MPFFSIIIPTFNFAHTIVRTITSVLNQVYVDFEIIIVDDGSMDDTKEVVLAIEDNRVKYFYQDNQGVCVARNTGAMKAKGNYLLFLDGDDYVSVDWLQDFYNEIQKSGATIVCCNSSVELINTVDSDAFLAGNFTVKKELFLKAGKYDENLKFGENTELKWRLDAENPTIATIQKNNFFYDNSQSNIGNKKKENQIEFSYYVLKKHATLLKNNKRWTQLLYQISGVNCIQLGRTKEGKQLLWKGYLSNPTHIKSLLRVIKYFIKN